MTHTNKSATATATSSQPAPGHSRILIHASSSENEICQHPRWHGDSNREITECPFSAEDGVTEMSEINARLERVLDKAPSDSTANLLLKKTSDGYKAFFKLRSTQSQFSGFIKGACLVDVVERVFREVRLQIDDWKETRHVAEDAL